ncbi:TatD family hydrolase [Komagataeibacter saccharivorans]|uniref:TatD family hydrolase n=1 Tax=Komagataeibacter saccharivorans TaxID=265959 RepID=UPI000C84C348|nr:TatD family hydrolase [Komagataeibacter saccharivorans]PMP98730.1 3'-5' ssDNA/RNA exonuclease TatD [Komagataeibacter saccharivorans]QBL93094.1 putative metal-dependent hydrolase YcfH [Komagataeibacter saccharivorans]
MTRTGLTDSHCHLDHFSDGELPEILARTQQAGVDGMVTIGTRLSRAQQQKKLATLDQPDLRVWCTIGTHPDHVTEEDLPDAATIAAMADDPCVVGIGESGLDYFHGQADVRPLQHESFRVHIDAARRTGLPLVIHTREADEDTLAILRDETTRNGAFPFLIHCFSSGPELARGALELGGYISFSGIATFSRAQSVRDVAKDVPADRLLVETDSPYLAPVPRRGKRNEPGYVAYTARVLAELRGMEDAAFAEMTTANFSRLFTQAV